MKQQLLLSSEEQSAFREAVAVALDDLDLALELDLDSNADADCAEEDDQVPFACEVLFELS